MLQKRNTWGKFNLKKINDNRSAFVLKRYKGLLSDEPSWRIPRFKNAPISEYITLDPFLINTIKLNSYMRLINERLLKSTDENIKINKPFPEINNPKSQNKYLNSSDSEISFNLRNVISVMCMHVGFNDVSLNVLKMLVNLLVSYIELFLINFQSYRNALENQLCKNSLKNLKCFSKGLKKYYFMNFIQFFKSTQTRALKLKKEYYYTKKKSYESSTNDSNDFPLGNFNNTNATILINPYDENYLPFNDELLEEFNAVNSEDEIEKLFKIIESDPFSLITEELE